LRDASSTGHIAVSVALNNDKATQLFAASGEDWPHFGNRRFRAISGQCR